MISSKDHISSDRTHANPTFSENGLAEPLVSIIIPNYNHGTYLGDAINSTLEQSYPNIEVIVVDDGSTDDSRTVAESFGDQITYIWQQNSGLCAARNTGLSAASGTYIGLLDADDILEPDYCSRLVSALLAFPDAEGIICGYRFVDQHNNALPQFESRCLVGQDLYEVLLKGNFLVPESVLLHQRCYKNAGPFDTSLTACEDWDMWLRVAKSHKIISTERVLTRHRVLPASMSSDPVRMLNNRLAVLGKHIGPEPTVGNATYLQSHTYGHVYFTSALEYEQIGDSEKAMTYFTKAASIYPEIMTDVSTFYEVGCSMQPKGTRGYLADLDIEQSEEAVEKVLDELVLRPDALYALAQQHREICSVAYWSLGLLAYGAGDSQAAQRFLWRVLTYEPSALLRKDYLSLLARSILGEAGVARAKRLVKYLAIILPRGGKSLS